MSPVFDLDALGPPPVTFRLRGVDYTVHGDPSIDVVERMLKIEERLEGDEAVAAAREGRDLLLELVQEHQPDVQSLEVSPREILVLFYLLMRGEQVAGVVGAALAEANGATPEPRPPSRKKSGAAKRSTRRGR